MGQKLLQSISQQNKSLKILPKHKFKGINRHFLSKTLDFTEEGSRSLLGLFMLQKYLALNRVKEQLRFYADMMKSVGQIFIRRTKLCGFPAKRKVLSQIQLEKFVWMMEHMSQKSGELLEPPQLIRQFHLNFM